MEQPHFLTAYVLPSTHKVPLLANFCFMSLMQKEPFAILKYPDNYRIGNVFSMIVFDLDVEDFQYAFRLDGPYDKKKGLLFDKHK
ncbi:hypothetical protein CLONEX_00284, partial [[Clostridium] nexile DSM 1787]